MVKYFYGIDHANTGDTDEEVLVIESTIEETKTIEEILLCDENNEGKMSMFVDREGFFEAASYHRTAKATIQNWLRIPINRKLEPGEKFVINLQNYAAGVNAEIIGMVVYEIE